VQQSVFFREQDSCCAAIGALPSSIFQNLAVPYNQWTWVPMYSGITTGKNELGVICLVFGLGSLWSFHRRVTWIAKCLTESGISLLMASLSSWQSGFVRLPIP